MAIELGIVTKLDTQAHCPVAWVKIMPTQDCEACSSRQGCHIAKGARSQEIRAVNGVKARVGDRIQVKMDTGSLLKVTFLLYLFPILCMVAGGLLAHWVCLRLHISGSLLPILSSLVFFTAAMLVARARGRLMGMKPAYQPRILRVIGHEPANIQLPIDGILPRGLGNRCTSPDPHHIT